VLVCELANEHPYDAAMLCAIRDFSVIGELGTIARLDPRSQCEANVMAAAGKKVTKKRASAQATRKLHAKNVKQAAMVKRLARSGGEKRETVKGRLRKAGVIRGDRDEVSPRAVRKWTGQRSM
jgi:hypothetical protein